MEVAILTIEISITNAIIMTHIKMKMPVLPSH
jgi:hypothetical protein